MLIRSTTDRATQQQQQQQYVLDHSRSIDLQQQGGQRFAVKFVPTKVFPWHGVSKGFCGCHANTRIEQ